MNKPKIAIRESANEKYYSAIAAADAIALPMIEGESLEDINKKTRIHGLVVEGGDFFFPDDWFISDYKSNYERSYRLNDNINNINFALYLDLPILGICAGMQILAALSGYNLTSNIAQTFNTQVDHRKENHLINIKINTLLYEWVKKSQITVNSFHNDALIESHHGIISAKSSDGVIEAIEIPDKSCAVGIQWHPEQILNSDNLAIFSGFAKACVEYKNS